MVSRPQTIEVKLTSPAPPYVQRNRPLIVMRGGKAILSPTENLSIGDDDSPGAITVTVVQGRCHIVFAKDMLESNHVIYRDAIFLLYQELRIFIFTLTLDKILKT